ncbi:hypothetical protein gpAD87_31220 [Paenibacillus sp. AD87]|nr:hypothetical protein gpAD87_31220 [Paenibacillus sp. AD87]
MMMDKGQKLILKITLPFVLFTYGWMVTGY